MSYSRSSTARCHILGLVCGYPKPQRDRRLLMVIQAYIDESEQKDEVFVLAGYIASAEKWAEFSDEWDELLKGSKWPYVKEGEDPYLHIAEVMGSRSPELIERAGWFYRVIERHVSHMICVAIPLQPLKRISHEVGLSSQLNRPFDFAFSSLITLLGEAQEKLGISEPIDFIFDERSGFDLSNDDWSHFKLTAKPELRQYFGNKPVFRDDRQVRPLQAADLIAWFVRKMWRDNGTVHGPKISFPWPAQPKIQIPTMIIEYNEERIRREVEELIRRVDLERRLDMPANVTVTFSGDIFCQKKDL